MKKMPLELDPRRIFTPRQRADIFIEFDGKCGICKKKIKVGGGWTAGHIIPHALGGLTTVENGQPECNDGCSAKTHREDTARSAKARRQAGETGQQARRARRDKPLIQNRGWNKTLKRKLNGKVVPR